MDALAARQASWQSRSCFHGRLEGPTRGFEFGTRFLGGLTCLRCLHFETGQAVALAKPLRCRTRRVGCGAETIPAPDIALEADQPLAGPQFRLQRLADCPAYNSDVSKASSERRRRFDKGGERFGAPRHGLRCRKRRQAPPVHRRRLIGRSVEVIAECRAQCCFIARPDGQRIDERRPQIPDRGVEKFIQCTDFSAEALGGAPAVLEGLPPVGFRLPHLAQRGAGRLQRGFRRRRRLARGFDRYRQPIDIR